MISIAPSEKDTDNAALEYDAFGRIYEPSERDRLGRVELDAEESSKQSATTQQIRDGLRRRSDSTTSSTLQTPGGHSTLG